MADNLGVHSSYQGSVVMGMAEPLEPESDPTPAPSLRAVPEPVRADWLVGAEEGIESVLESGAGSETEQRLLPKLARPGATEGESVVAAPSPVAVSQRPRPVGAVTPEQQSGEFTPGLALSWGTGANSVPAIRREPARSTMPSEPTRDFPMDDAEERARTREREAMLAEVAAETLGRPHDVVDPEAFNVTAPPLPWWMQALETLRTDRRLQISAALGLLVILTIAFYPRGERGVSLADLKQRPDHFDGQDVKIKGKVGEVYSVGGGYAFYLHQGRDTMVVFTRVRTPRTRDVVQITGHVSTGYLDGQPRLALFENTAPEKK